MDLLKSFAYMTLWSAAFVAVFSVTAPVMSQIEDFIGGN